MQYLLLRRQLELTRAHEAGVSMARPVPRVRDTLRIRFEVSDTGIDTEKYRS